MPTSLTLETVQAEFQHWRDNKANPKSRVPAQLKQSAVALCESYSSAIIVSALGINSTMLNRWGKQIAESSDPLNTGVEFMT